MSAKKMKYCPWCSRELIRAERHGHKRTFCPDKSCGYVFWDNPKPVVAAILERAGNIVLVRSHGWPENWYGLVTGFLEKGEMPEEAVLREVKEETGLDVRLGEYIGMYPFREMNQLIIAYHVTAEDGDIQLDTKELAGYREVPIEKIQPWPMGTGMALRDWLKSRGYEREFINLKR